MALDQNTLIFSDDFPTGPVSSANWKPNIGAGSYYGNTQQRPTLPNAVNGHAVLQLDTFNPSGLSYFGSEMISVPTFDVNAQGPLIFQATLKYEQAQKGIIGGFFTLGPVSPTVHDEIDIELMSKFDSQFQTNIYHQAPYDSGNPKSYSPGGFSQTTDHVYRIEWLPGGMAKWYVDGQLYRTASNAPGTPNVPENLHFNIWVGFPNWGVSDPSMPLPTSQSSQNKSFFLDVSQVRVWTASSMNGSAAADTLLGTTGSEYINAGAGNDTITGGRGDDVIEGGAGVNTAVYSSAARNHELSVTAGVPAAFVKDRFGTDGTDTLANIQLVRFADQTLDVTSLMKASNLGVSSFIPVIDLYNAYLHRAPDALGLAYWAARLGDGASLTDVAKAFYFSAEASALRPAGQTATAMVSEAYASILGRSADAGGLAYWAGELQSGRLAPELFPVALVQAIQSGAGSAADAQALASKERMGIYYAVTKGLTNSTHARSVFDGVSDAVLSKTMTDGFAAAAAAVGAAELVVNLVGVNLEPILSVA